MHIRDYEGMIGLNKTKITGVNTLSKLKLESKLRKQTDFGDIFNNQYFKQTHFSKLIH